MGYRRVRFNNFRNLEPREMVWSPGLNLLTGANGAGKTNILEGMNIISGWGPLERGTKTASLPTWNSGASEVQLTGELDDLDIIKVKIAGRFILRLNDKVTSATDLRWKIPVLTFLPCDMAILEDSASYRRRLLDMVLALLVPPYAVRLHDYKRGIRQKTAMLRSGAPSDIVDRALFPLTVWIWKMRTEAVALLSECLSELGGLLPGGMEISLKRGGAGREMDFEKDYLSSLMANKDRERAMKIPVVGPHRDDMIIKCRDKSAAECLSRGYRRRAAIALMLAASDGVRRKLGREPVLLLDEVTAELDAEGRKLLFDSLLERKAQVFAATAEPFTEKFPGEIYKVEGGTVINI